MTLRNLIDKGLLSEASQIDIDEADIGVSFFVDTVIQHTPEKKEIEVLRVETSDDMITDFPLDSEVEFDGLAIVMNSRFNVSHELYFKKVVDIDPSKFV